jgi:hypothetical protein
MSPKPIGPTSFPISLSCGIVLFEMLILVDGRCNMLLKVRVIEESGFEIPFCLFLLLPFIYLRPALPRSVTKLCPRKSAPAKYVRTLAAGAPPVHLFSATTLTPRSYQQHCVRLWHPSQAFDDQGGSLIQGSLVYRRKQLAHLGETTSHKLRHLRSVCYLIGRVVRR